MSKQSHVHEFMLKDFPTISRNSRSFNKLTNSLIKITNRFFTGYMLAFGVIWDAIDISDINRYVDGDVFRTFLKTDRTIAKKINESYDFLMLTSAELHISYVIAVNFEIW